jgi:major vault protein
MYVVNKAGFDFRFDYNGKEYCIPNDGKKHSIREMNVDFGQYIKILNQRNLKMYETGSRLKGTKIQKVDEKEKIIYTGYTGYTGSNSSDEFGGDSFVRSSSSNAMYMANVQQDDRLNFINYPQENLKQGESMPVNERENDLVLSPGEYAFIRDNNTGSVNVAVGPTKQTLTNTDESIIYDSNDKKFVPITATRKSIQQFVAADEQSYIVLENPVTKDGKLVHPLKASLNKPEELEDGRKVNIKGPERFPLWPGQTAKVIRGHQLRSNQYLVVKVVNADEAKKNQDQATVEGKVDKVQKIQQYVTGQLIIIKGTNVSFYIPPTGMEVVPDPETNEFVRDALTLERLEYCVLKDENGDKRYEEGPAVVFPEPTEVFVTKASGSKTYNAVELNENMGLYVKSISDHTENGVDYKAGDELFITGNDKKIYFPRPEHAVIKYGRQIKHYAVAIPEGKARYVLDKLKGKVDLVKGPRMFLPDPRKEVIVKRKLDLRDVTLWFPGNDEAYKYNASLEGEGKAYGYNTADVSSKNLQETAGHHTRSTMRFTDDSTLEEFSDGLKREAEYTPPRTISLNDKYEGAVNINVWPGYAVQVVSSSGERRVVEGPASIILQYDETLEKLYLSTGRPKNDNRTLDTVYLHTSNNKVSDLVSVETKDLVDVDVEVSYRVNFLDEYKDKWFSVQNYTKFLSDHLRSIIRNAVKKYGVEEFNDNAIDIIRDTVLGKSKDGERECKTFIENGMNVYDVEVLNVTINNDEIAEILINNQHQVVSDTIDMLQTKKRLEVVTEKEEAERKMIETKNATDIVRMETQKKLEKAKAERDAVSVEASLEIQPKLNDIAENEVGRKTLEDERQLERFQKQSEIAVKANKEALGSITPGLIEALNSYGAKNLATALVENLPEATGQNGFALGLGGVEGLTKMVQGTDIEKTIKTAMSAIKSQNSKANK